MVTIRATDQQYLISVTAACCQLYCSSLLSLFCFLLSTAASHPDHQRGAVNYRGTCQSFVSIVLQLLLANWSFFECKNVPPFVFVLHFDLLCAPLAANQM